MYGHLSRQHLVCRRAVARTRRAPAGPHHLQCQTGVLSASRRQCGRARRLLPAPGRAAVAGPCVRRQAHVRLPRLGGGLRRQNRVHARSARGRLSRHPRLPGGGALWLYLGLARRCGQSGRSHHSSAALAQPPRLGLWRWAVPRQGRLPPHGRQPDGPDARNLCARQQHWSA